MTKRFLSVLLTAVILLTALPLTVGAADSSVGQVLTCPFAKRPKQLLLRQELEKLHPFLRGGKRIYLLVP